MVGHRNALHPHNHVHARKRAAQPKSLLIKHYTLFNSLRRYTFDDPSSIYRSNKGLSATAQVHKSREQRLQRRKERYPVGEIWSYTWPVPFPKLPAQSQKPGDALDELVERLVEETFNQDYAKFRAPKWAREHRITQEHMEKIVVDPKDVAESTAAAKVLVHQVLSRFMTGVKKGSIGKRIITCTTSAANDNISSLRLDASNTEQAERDTSSTDVGPEDDAEVERGLDEEMWQDEEYSLEWKGMLDYFQSTAGSSKTAQWRNWHLLTAIAKTRRRCEELFGHETR